MRALRISKPGAIALREVPFDASPNECCVRVTTAGICGTDLQLLEGYADFTGIPGHEFVGVVEGAPSRHKHLIGKRVVGEINVGCGTCDWCKRGIKEHCPTRTVVGIRGRDGAFAQHIALPTANLHVLPDTVTNFEGVFVEPVAAACRILEQLELESNLRIAIVGDGRLGLLTAQVLRAAGLNSIVFGKHPEKLEVAGQLNLAVASESKDYTTSFDVVIEATGKPEGLERAIALVRPRGTIVMKSTFHGESPTALWPVVVHEITVIGSRCGPFPLAIDLLAAGSVRVAPLISRVLPLEEYETAFEVARHELKVIFDLSRVR